jgi:hypothetical protein
MDVLEFEIQYRINPVLARQDAKTVLPAVPGEQRALAASSLPIEIQFRGPLAGGAVLQFQHAAQKLLALARLSRYATDRDFQVARLFDLMCIGHEKRTFATLERAGR